MAKKLIKWFDKDGDYIEVLFMERIDNFGKVLGNSIFGINQIRKESPVLAELEYA